MPNKTIYVSEKDASLFEQAKEIAGEALSSVIVRALSEFVSRNQAKKKGMKEITVKVGKDSLEREQRFIGSWIGDWSGFSDDKQWYQKATIYRTQKENWAVLLETLYKASLLTNSKEWKESGDYLINPKRCDLLVGKSTEELKDKLPADLYYTLTEYAKHDENTVEYLDI
ncbi:MAG TPA: EXLDI protein [Patescibacteria group bacterium]|nr:EXLDI protein [Patescibacteria group bacterium]